MGAVANHITRGLVIFDAVLDGSAFVRFTTREYKAGADDLPVAIRNRKVGPDLAHPVPSRRNRPEREVVEAQPLWPDSGVDHSDDHIFSGLAVRPQPPARTRQSQELSAAGGSKLDG